MKINLPGDRWETGAEIAAAPARPSRVWLVYLLLALGTFALYARAINYEFVNYDDYAYLTENGAIQNGLTPDAIVWAFTTGRESNWHPLTWISHMVDVALFGLQHPGGHHLVNILFHIANTLLLFHFLRRVTRVFWRSAIVAALFAWHPMHVESVAWVAERKDVLSTFFGLLAMLSYARYVSEIKLGGPRIRQYYCLTLLCFAIGLMCKPMLVTLPFVLLLLDYWPLKRSAAESSGENRKSWLQLFIEKIPFFALTLVSSIVTYLVQQRGRAVVSFDILPIRVRLIHALAAYVEYIRKMFWPKNLSVINILNDQSLARSFWLSLLLLLGISIFAVWQRRTRPWILIGWLWFLGMLVPVIGLVQVGSQALADRYTYMPFVGLFIILSWGFNLLLQEIRFARLQPIIVVSTLGTCWLLSWHQIGFWKNSETLFRHAVELEPGNLVAHVNLGRAYYDTGRRAEATDEFKKALIIAPESPVVLNNMAIFLAHENKPAEAIELYQKAIQREPDATKYYNLANSLVQLGRYDEAVVQYGHALEMESSFADAHNNLGAVLLRQGKLPEAIVQFQQALKNRPNFVEAQYQLGNALLKSGKVPEAELHFNEAIRLQPGFAMAQFKLGFILAQRGEVQQAVDHFHLALKANPKDANTWFNLGAAEEAMKHTNDAIAAFKEVLQIKPGDAEAQERMDGLMKPAAK